MTLSLIKRSAAEASVNTTSRRADGVFGEYDLAASCELGNSIIASERLEANEEG